MAPSRPISADSRPVMILAHSSVSTLAVQIGMHRRVVQRKPFSTYRCYILLPSCRPVSLLYSFPIPRNWRTLSLSSIRSPPGRYGGTIRMTRQYSTLELVKHDETARAPERDHCATAFELDSSRFAPEVSPTRCSAVN